MSLPCSNIRKWGGAYKDFLLSSPTWTALQDVCLAESSLRSRAWPPYYQPQRSSVKALPRAECRRVQVPHTSSSQHAKDSDVLCHPKKCLVWPSHYRDRFLWLETLSETSKQCRLYLPMQSSIPELQRTWEKPRVSYRRVASSHG